MTLLDAQRAAVTGMALAGAIFFALASWVVWQARALPLHVNGVLVRAEGVESKLYATSGNLDKATAAWAASARGQADAVEGLVKDAHGTLSTVDLTLASLRSNSDALNGELAALERTTDAATGLANGLSADAATANTLLAHGQPAIDAGTRAMRDIDSLVTDPQLTDAVGHWNETTAHLAASTGDFQTRFHALLFPAPCRTFGCRMSRYVWPALRDGAALGEAGYWTATLLGRDVPVKVVH